MRPSENQISLISADDTREPYVLAIVLSEPLQLSALFPASSVLELHINFNAIPKQTPLHETEGDVSSSSAAAAIVPQIPVDEQYQQQQRRRRRRRQQQQLPESQQTPKTFQTPPGVQL